MSVTPYRDTHADREQEPAAHARAYTWWKQFSGEHSWIGRRLHDIGMAPTYGWRFMAGWIKTVILTGAALAGFLSLYGIGSTVIEAARALPWSTPTSDDHTGLLATIDQPVRSYLATHTQTLPIQRLHTAIGDIPPHEHETNYYAQHQPQPAAGVNA
ncbi:hypothetical protein [Streptomyces sp. NPDC001340]